MQEDQQQSLLKNLDWGIIAIYLVLVVFGWLNIYSALYDADNPELLNLSKNYGKQAIWIVAALLIGFGILILDTWIFSTMAYGFYVIGIGLLVITLIAGEEVAGSKSWLNIGGFGLQASEFAKFTTSLALVKYLSRYQVSMTNFKDGLIGMLIFLLPMGLILLQNDTGTALVYTSFLLVLLRQGLPGLFLYVPLSIGVLLLSVLLFPKIMVIIVVGVIALLIYWVLRKQKRALLIVLGAGGMAIALVYAVDYGFNNFLQSHQQERINVLLGKEIDRKGAGYNSQQSLIAIGAGGFSGKGFLNGTQTKYNFVPEQSTDFIFCTIGEEYGFIGSAGLVLLYALLLIKLVLSAEKQKATFPKLYGYCVFSILFIHFTINIGMTMGLLPIIGIPLPFLSYGGSALLGFTMLLAIYLKLNASQMRFYH